MTAINPQAVRGPVTAVPVVAGKGVRLREDVENNRVVAELDETVLYNNASPSAIISDTELNLSESYLNFEKLKIYVRASGGNTYQICYVIEGQVFQSEDIELAASPICNASGSILADMNAFCFITTNPTKCYAKSNGIRVNITSAGAINTTSSRGVKVYKIVGINRISASA